MANGPDFVRLDSCTWYEHISGYVERKPQVTSTDFETWWHDADKDRGHTVDSIGIAKELGVAIEEFGPEAVTSDEDGRGPRLLIVSGQGTTE